ncbi:uncharacterized protein LOC142583167 isoform X2 [Dermacentor variabilis]|uniref:uncharacterized protein LOC142583167 isoform X2 n=1 Tax=Dermacentor variabilis TaxID=34621 RepID=UPI003F5B9297
MHTNDYQRGVTCATFLLTSQVFKKWQQPEVAILYSTLWVHSGGSYPCVLPPPFPDYVH